MPRIAPFALTFALLLGGCASIGEFKLPPVLGGPTPGEQKLAEGIGLYERGEYVDAIRVLNAAEIGESDVPTRVAASKYLAFSYCVTQRRTLCRRSFDTVLRLDSGFDLQPAESGHPLWGPVFVQARKAAERRTN